MADVSASDLNRRWWSAWARIGVPSGLTFGALQLGLWGESIARAVGGAIFFGVFFGATMTFVARRSAKGLAGLDGRGRTAVTNAVRNGDAIDDPQLAPAILEYSAWVHTRLRREQAFGVLALPLGLGAVALLIAIGNAISGSARAAVAFLIVSVMFAAPAVGLPARRARALSNLERAETAARRLLGADGSGSAPPEAPAR